MWYRAFAEEEQETPEKAAVEADPEPEYVFEGFTVEFSTKVMLTPTSDAKGRAT